MIGQYEGRDFAFLVRMKGKVYRVVAEHINRGSARQVLACIRPANLYGRRMSA